MHECKKDFINVLDVPSFIYFYWKAFIPVYGWNYVSIKGDQVKLNFMHNTFLV